MNSGGNWKGIYGYDTKHSSYSTDYKSKITQSGVGVGTGQLTYKRCGILKPSHPSGGEQKSCTTGTCPWR